MSATSFRGWRRRFLAAAALTLVGAMALIAPSSPALATGPQVIVGSPIDGKWAYDQHVDPPYTDANSSHPSVHAKYYGDWATDLYAAAGTDVKLEVTSYDGTVTFSLNRTNDTCSSVGPNIAGHGIVLNVLVNGVTVGSIDYEHLDNIKMSDWHNGDVIGKITSESLSSTCYSVRHTHIELKNATSGTYSCWVDHGNPGNSIGVNDPVGLLGATNTGQRQSCGSLPTGTTPPPPNRVTGGGALSTRGDHRLDMFIQGTNTSGANTYHNWSDAAPWVGWHLLEASTSTRVASAVASVSWSPNRIDLFARGEDGSLLHKWWNADTGWGDWVSNGGCIIGAPTVTSWGPGRLDVFAKGCNATGPNLVHNWWDGSNWWWETVAESGGTRIASAPSATAWSYGRIDLFAQSTSNNLLHKWYNDSSGWGDWVSNGGCIQGVPAVSSWAAGRLDVFAPGCYSSGNNLVHNWWDGSSWYWELVPSGDNLYVTNVLGAVSWGYGRIDIAGRTTSGEPVHKWYDGTSWSDWEHLGGGVAP